MSESIKSRLRAIQRQLQDICEELEQRQAPKKPLRRKRRRSWELAIPKISEWKYSRKKESWRYKIGDFKFTIRHRDGGYFWKIIRRIDGESRVVGRSEVPCREVADARHRCKNWYERHVEDGT